MDRVRSSSKGFSDTSRFRGSRSAVSAGKNSLAGEPDQTSIRWRIRNVVHAFIVASVLSGLHFVRVEVEAQRVLQALRVAKQNTSTYVYI
jgi:hypothetical protein